MVPEEFLFALSILNWTFAELAEHLECDSRLVRRWAYGEASIPPQVAEWLQSLMPFYEKQANERDEFHERHPPPTDWRVRK